MAVQLNHEKKNILQVSDVLIYQYEKENLIKMTDTLFGVPEETNSLLQFQDIEFKPFRIHLTTMLHKGSHDYELIAEHIGKSESLFICFALKKSNNLFSPPELTFPLVESPLEGMLKSVSDCLYYKTSTNNHVFFCSKMIHVGDDFPTVIDSPKNKYKEIFEPYTFESNRNIITQRDRATRVIDTRLPHHTTQVEGFKSGQTTVWSKLAAKQTVPATAAAGATVAYMECDLITNDKPGHNTSMSEYALTPLNANTYERGMVNFVHFLHFTLVVCVGGIILPYVQCNLKPKKTKLEDWVKYSTWFHWLSFILSIILLIVGLAAKKMNSGKRRTIAMFGLYIMILIISNIVGMAIQFPFSKFYNKDYITKEEYEDDYGFNRIVKPMFRYDPDFHNSPNPV